MRGRSNKIVEMLSRILIDISCVQKSRWRGESAHKTAGRNSYYKFFWMGDDSGKRGVGELVAEKWFDNVITAIRHSTRLCHDCFVENQ